MIPRRVEVKGFLCYRDPQVVDLDGCDLWAFSGRNGSGKSAIFDAITFALFGAHRGGQRGAENLIHVDASEFSIAFDFELGVGHYRIRRSLRKGGRAERQVFCHEPGGDGGEHWLPVPETDTDAGLKRWVEENVGLGFDVFTSSVLLRQGEADKLLDAGPSGRFKILAGIVDLARYRRLHDLADRRRKSARDRADDLRARLANTPVVGPEAFEAAEAGLAGANSAVADASAERDRLGGVEILAGRWTDLVAQRGKAVEEREAAGRLLAESDAIRDDWSRLQDLDRVLPAIEGMIARREKIGQAVADIDGRERKRKEAEREVAEMTRLIDENRRALQGVIDEIGRDEERRRAIADRLAALAAPIHRAILARAQRETVEALGRSLAEFPDDLEADVARLDAESRLRSEWKAAWPSLLAFSEARKALADARSRVVAAGASAGRAQDATRRSATLLDGLRASASAAYVQRDEARIRSSVAQTTLGGAENRLRAFEGLEGAGTCNRCRQPLSPGHFAEELDRLRDERDDARRDAEAADRALREAEDRASADESARAEAEVAHRRAEDGLREARREVERASGDAEASARACATAFEHLDEAFRLAIARPQSDDWPGTSFPTPDDLAEGRRLRDGLGDARKSLDEARSRLSALREKRAQLDEARRSLDAIGLQPGDESAEAEHVTLSEKAEALDHCLASHRREKGSGEASAERMTEHIEGLGRQVAEVDALDSTDRALIREWRAEAAKAREAVPEPWRAAFDEATRDQLDAWESERSSLRDRGVESLAAGLNEAEAEIRRAGSRIADCEEGIAAIPEEARRDPEEIAAAKAGAAKRHADAEAELLARRAELDSLVRALRDRQDFESRLREAEGSWSVADTLARLLGRDGLQRELLRDAERGILDCARPILREVSGGELDLRLAGDGGEEADDEHALALEALVRTHGSTRALDVAYLSGSQKFRVAVSLALAIGQYARGLDRPIRSVIIDEGFGCLDRQGRDEMIAELNALTGRLARIVLVSHQEEFADAFRDGYHFEVKGGTTVAEPFHR